LYVTMTTVEGTTAEDKFKVLKDRLETVLNDGKDREDVLAVLDLIDKEKKDMTLALLKKTRLGVPVGKLTKDSDPDISQQAKKIISEWKKLTETKTNSGSSSESKKTVTKRPSEDDLPSVGGTPAKRSKKTSETKPTPAKSTTPPATASTSSGSSVRDKLRGLVERALSKEKEKEGETFLYSPAEAAKWLEQAVFEKHNSIASEDYISHMRMLFLNFDSSSRSDLRREVLDTEDIRQWASMSSEQLMSSEQRRELKANQEERLRVLKGKDPLANVAEGINQCSRCGSRRIATFQLQTRGADEPMTVFYTCADCKKRWRS